VCDISNMALWNPSHSVNSGDRFNRRFDRGAACWASVWFNWALAWFSI